MPRDYVHGIDCFLCGRRPGEEQHEHYWMGRNDAEQEVAAPVCDHCYSRLTEGKSITGLNKGGKYAPAEVA